MNALVAQGMRQTAKTMAAAPIAPSTGAGVSAQARRQTNGLRLRYQPAAWPSTTIAMVAQNAGICSGAGSPDVGTNILVSITHPAFRSGERNTTMLRQNRTNM